MQYKNKTHRGFGGPGGGVRGLGSGVSLGSGQSGWTAGQGLGGGVFVGRRRTVGCRGWGGADNPLTTTLTSGHYVQGGAPHDQGGYTAIRGLV